MNGYYFAIYEEVTVIIKYRKGNIYMCGIDESFEESDFDDIDFENCIHFL